MHGRGGGKGVERRQREAQARQQEQELNIKRILYKFFEVCMKCIKQRWQKTKNKGRKNENMTTTTQR